MSNITLTMGERDYFQCGMCTYVFDSFIKFMEHKIDHIEPATTVRCSLCSREFSQQSCLKDHLRRVHSVIIVSQKLEDKKNVTLKPRESCARCNPINSTKKNNATKSGFLHELVTFSQTERTSVVKDEAYLFPDNSFVVIDVTTIEESMDQIKTSNGFNNVLDERKPSGSRVKCIADESSRMNEENRDSAVDMKMPSLNSEKHTWDLSLDISSSQQNILQDSGLPVIAGTETQNLPANSSIQFTNRQKSHSIVESNNIPRNALSFLTGKECEMHFSPHVKTSKADISATSCHTNGDRSGMTKTQINSYDHVKSLLSSPSLTTSNTTTERNAIPQLQISNNSATGKEHTGHSCGPSKSTLENCLSQPVKIGPEDSSTKSLLLCNSEQVQPSEKDLQPNCDEQDQRCKENSLHSVVCSSTNDSAPQPRATTFLLPLPLNLKATRNFCEALNLSFKASNQSHFESASTLMSPGQPSTNLVASLPSASNSKIIQLNNMESNTEATKESIGKDFSEKNSYELDPGNSGVLLGPKFNVSSDHSLENTRITNNVQDSKQISDGIETVKQDDSPSHVDFYFLLGSMNIKGSSLTYDRTDFRCLHCAFSTAWRPSLVKHMKYIHKDTLDVHKMLDIRKNETLENEPQNSNVKKSKDFQVMKMSEYMTGNQKPKVLKRRIRKLERQDLEGTYHCPTCHKTFSRLRYMRRHQATHRTERSHLCDNCGKSFKTKAVLVAHRRCHKTKTYHCPQCSFSSSSSAAIHAHRQLHPNGSVICDICGNAYIDKSTLNKHRKVHDINRPYPCTHQGCTWRFKTDVMRKAHVRSHTTTGKFRCPHCGYNFRQKHHLQRHIAKIHNSQPAQSLSSPSSISALAHAVSSPNNATSVFGSQILSSGPPSNALDPLTPPSGTAQHDIFSPTTNHLLSPISDTTFNSSIAGGHEQGMIEVLVGDKHESLSGLEGEEEKSSSGLSNLEYITDTGEVVQLVRPGQTYMGRDQHGNLVQYKIADTQNQDESSHPIYFIGVDGTVVGAANSQEQALLVNTSM